MVESLRERCVTEAMKLIGESGVDRLSLRDVARRLSVSHQAPYKHFTNREHLLAAASGRAYEALAACIGNRAKKEDPAEDLFEIGKSYLQFARSQPETYRLLFVMSQKELESYPDIQLNVEWAREELKSAIATLTKCADPVYLDEASHFAWSSIHGLASLESHRRGHEGANGADHFSIESLKALRYICSSVLGQAPTQGSV